MPIESRASAFWISGRKTFMPVAGVSQKGWLWKCRYGEENEPYCEKVLYADISITGSIAVSSAFDVDAYAAMFVDNASYLAPVFKPKIWHDEQEWRWIFVRPIKKGPHIEFHFTTAGKEIVIAAICGPNCAIYVQVPLQQLLAKRPNGPIMSTRHRVNIPGFMLPVLQRDENWLDLQPPGPTFHKAAFCGIRASCGVSFLRLGREQQRIAFASSCIRGPRCLGFRDILCDDTAPASVCGDHHPLGLVLSHAEFCLQDGDDELAGRIVVVEQNDLVKTRGLGLYLGRGRWLGSDVSHDGRLPIAARHCRRGSLLHSFDHYIGGRPPTLLSMTLPHDNVLSHKSAVRVSGGVGCRCPGMCSLDGDTNA